VSFSWNDRRLFEYRFQQKFAYIEVSKSIRERVAALIQSSKTVKSNREPMKPLRRWNDEGWYVSGEEAELQAYRKENQATPPQEVVDLSTKETALASSCKDVSRPNLATRDYRIAGWPQQATSQDPGITRINFKKTRFLTEEASRPAQLHFFLDSG
jgi:hypothetical protein